MVVIYYTIIYYSFELQLAGLAGNSCGSLKRIRDGLWHLMTVVITLAVC